MFTSGSLFSGVGGWDRAVEMCGGKTLWFSEYVIEGIEMQYV